MGGALVVNRIQLVLLRGKQAEEQESNVWNQWVRKESSSIATSLPCSTERMTAHKARNMMRRRQHVAHTLHNRQCVAQLAVHTSGCA